MAEKDDEYFDYDAAEQHDMELWEREAEARAAAIEACAAIIDTEVRRYESGNPGPTERKVAELLLILAIKIRALKENTNP